MAQKVRFHALDEARGFAVLCMVFYHAFYTMAYSFNIEFGKKLLDFFTPAEPFFAMFFIFLSGIMSQLTRSNLIRGLKLSVVAVAVSAVTIWLMPRFGFGGNEIYFGVLHLLSCGMLLVALVNPRLKEIKFPIIPIIVFVCLFAATYNIELGYVGIKGIIHYNLPRYIYQGNFLSFLGFHNMLFASADYFPIFPWIFMFFAGASVGIYAARGKFPNFLKPRRIIPLGYMGRHALIIYVLHQPVIFGIIIAINWVISLF